MWRSNKHLTSCRWNVWSFCTGMLYMGHFHALPHCKSINIRILMLTSTGHNLETCGSDWYRGPDFESLGSFCEEIWLYSIIWRRERKVRINLLSNYYELSYIFTKVNCAVSGSVRIEIHLFIWHAIIAGSNLFMLLMLLPHLLQSWRMMAPAWGRLMNWVVQRSILCMNW